MKKLSKIFAVVLCLALALSMLPFGAAAAAETVTYDFSDVEMAPANNYETMTNDAILAAFQADATGTGLVSVEGTKIYPGNNSTSGAFPSTGGFLKTGSGSSVGQLVMTFSKKVTKVEVVCHDWYKKSADHPTNSNTVAVNGSEAVLAPYTENATCGTLSFNLATASETVTMDFNKRVFVKSITVTFEESAPTTTATTATTGTTATTATTATNGTQNPDDTGDTGIVSMTAVMALAVTALAALVIGNKKRMF